MKNADLFKLKENWNKLNNLSGLTFLMELRRNKRLVDQEIEVLESIKDETPEYKKFREEYINEKKNYADKDGEGNAIMVSLPQNPSLQTYQVNQKAKEWAKKEQEIIAKHKKTIEVMDKRNDDFVKAMDQECTCDWYMITEKSIPKTITNEQLDLVDFMIDMELEEEKPNVVKPKNIKKK